MNKKKLIWGIILIVIASGISIQATLTISTPIRSLMNSTGASLSFYLGSIIAAVLLWLVVFALLIAGVKLIRSSRKRKGPTSVFDKFK